MPPVPSVLDIISRRFAIPRGRSTLIGVERVLASVRTVLAFSSLLLLWLNPGVAYPRDVAAILVYLYLAHAIGLLAIVYLRAEISPRFSFLVHSGDILWAAVISLFGGAAENWFFLYFIFALLAAAFRWGMRETAMTTVAVVATMALDSIARARAPLAAHLGHPSVAGFIMRSINLVIFSFLIGYIAESEKRRVAEALSISRISATVRIESGLKGTVQIVMQELLDLFGGRELLVVTRESEAHLVMLWRAEKLATTGNVVFTWMQLDESEQQEYLCVMGEDSAGAAWHNRNTSSDFTLDKNGVRTRGHDCHLAPKFVKQHPFRLLLACAISAAPEVSARLLLVDPTFGGRAETQLRFLQDVANLVAPSVYNVYLLRRLRSRAAAVERARVSRELHDGVVQSLHAIAFRLYALRTRAAASLEDRETELLEVQQLVQNEAANVRNLIHQLEPLDFDPRHLVDFLSGMVTRYRQDTGIGAQFVCDTPQVNLPPGTCRELAGIVREALANVRRHSGAQHVLVRLARQQGGWVLTIEDDGRGFSFSGRFTHAQLEEDRRGPLVIKQRVRAIEGELTIISKAGQGARLEIKVPDFARASIA
ncbi:MAG TPA: histidine kinase [Terriglobales bacterium]|jgi:signal transduction histidine kinase|nr:histidine kinase [Terriglobales bacterium]